MFKEVFGPTTGLLYFLLLYLGGIVVSDIPTYLRHRNDPGYRSLGASGGVASVIFSAILFNPVAGLYIFPLPIAIPGFIFGFLYLAYSYYMSQRRGDNINHDAHFYGALLRYRADAHSDTPGRGHFLGAITGLYVINY